MIPCEIQTCTPVALGTILKVCLYWKGESSSFNLKTLKKKKKRDAKWVWGNFLLKLLGGFHLRISRTFVRFVVEKSCLTSGIYTENYWRKMVCTILWQILKYAVNQKNLLGHAVILYGPQEDYNIENGNYISQREVLERIPLLNKNKPSWGASIGSTVISWL